MKFFSYFEIREYLFESRTVGYLIGVASIFLAFRINVGYSRWYSARQIWGGFVSSSRIFAIYVTSSIRSGGAVSEEDREICRRLIYGQIGYVNALRLQLRLESESKWDEELWRKKINGKYIFNHDEVLEIKKSQNRALQILQKQSDIFADYCSCRNFHQNINIKMIDILSDISQKQGQAEGIKSTVVPWGYSAYTKILCYFLSFMVICSNLNTPDIQNIFLVSFVSFVFLTIDQVSNNLDNPFEGSFNDTPMSSLCRIIEINLLNQIDDPCDIKPLMPIKGRLD